MMTLDTKPQIDSAILNIDDVEVLDKPHIVVVEDEYIMTHALQLILHPRFNPIFFTKADEALSYIRQNWATIDLLIFDYMLPDMNGLELLSIIKQDGYKKHLPAVLYTACSKEILDKASTKPDVYLEKPCTKEQILFAIQSVLDQQK